VDDPSSQLIIYNRVEVEERKPSADDDEKTVEPDFATTLGTPSIAIVDTHTR
jgi:hypothetical protein